MWLVSHDVVHGAAEMAKGYSALSCHLCCLRSWNGFCQVGQTDVMCEANFLEVKIKVSWRNQGTVGTSGESSRHHITANVESRQ